jgi:hypothetical protein
MTKLPWSQHLDTCEYSCMCRLKPRTYAVHMFHLITHGTWGPTENWASVHTLTDPVQTFMFTQFETHSFELEMKRAVALMKGSFSTAFFQWPALQLVVYLRKTSLDFVLFCYKPNKESIAPRSNNVLQCFFLCLNYKENVLVQLCTASVLPWRGGRKKCTFFSFGHSLSSS